LVEVVGFLPSQGRALDVAGGSGRNALYLAHRGLDVTLVDVSPVAVGVARDEAARRSLRLDVMLADLEEAPLPSGPWDIIVCFHYLQRDLFPNMTAALVAGGVLVCEIATVRNLERNDRPPLPYLLHEGELLDLVPGLAVVRHEERWTEEGRHEARLLATSPLSGD
ncbi:MAG TPA: methyltransferase domain-containing protein, partial [Acidimicrobiia bacterium]